MQALRIYPYAVMTTEGEAGAAAEAATVEGAEGTPAESAPAHWTSALGEDHLGFLKGFEKFEDLQARLTVPEDYTAPEGADAAVFDGFKAFAKENGFTQAQVDALVKFDVARMGSLPETLKAAQKAQFQEGLKAREAEIGAAKFKEEMTLGQLTMKTLGNEKMAKWLDASGLGDSPEMIQFFALVGRHLTEDSYTNSATVAEDDSIEAQARRRFPTMK